jgi:hypothetical protein
LKISNKKNKWEPASKIKINYLTKRKSSGGHQAKRRKEEKPKPEE